MDGWASTSKDCERDQSPFMDLGRRRSRSQGDHSPYVSLTLSLTLCLCRFQNERTNKQENKLIKKKGKRKGAHHRHVFIYRDDDD